MIKPLIGSFTCRAEAVSLIFIFADRLEDANENENVMIAANAIRIKTFVFITSRLNGYFLNSSGRGYLPFEGLKGSCSAPVTSFFGLISSSVQEVKVNEEAKANKRR
jgi:hypothetical protein